MRYLLLSVALAACSTARPVHDDHVARYTFPLMSADAIAGQTYFEAPGVRHVGLRLDGQLTLLEVRAETDAGWTDWRPVEVTWSEGSLHVARAAFPLADAIELRGTDGLTAMVVELSERVPDGTLTRDLPRQVDGPYASLRRALAPEGMVITRAEWGARDPDRICGDVVDPYRLSVHHTAIPADDGGDAAARLRQMQAFHIDTREWCDIGYHFVVSQAGDIYQGRSDERRPAAHVGGQNSGNIGISLIGDYQVQAVNPTQFAAAAQIMGWALDEYDIPANRESVRGHREWPGQNTTCPGNNLLNRLEEMIELATGDRPDPPDPPPVDPPDDVDVRFGVRWLQTPGDRNRQGSSGGIPDGFVGERFQVAFQVENRASSPMRGVRLGYAFGPGWRATNYVIQTDHPARDQMTWMVNDADSAPENPAKDALGSEGVLTMYAFGQRETKRVVVDLEFEAYAGWRAPAQGWMANIDGVYAQDAFGAAPLLNNAGARLQGQVEADVLAPDGWRFPAPEADDVEGWTACPDDAAPTQQDGIMLVDGCAKSPGWTAIDAETWDSLAFRFTAADPTVILQWTGGAAEFEVASVLDPVAVDLSGIPEWAGEVRGLRILGNVDVDAIWPQSKARREAAYEPFSENAVAAAPPSEPLPILDAAIPDAAIPDAGVLPDWGTDEIDGFMDGDATLPADEGDGGGCQQAPGAAWWMLGLLGLTRIGGRRRCASN